MTFTHSEKPLAARLGLQQKDLRTVRADELERGRDWQTVGGEVRYSDAGIERLSALLKISSVSPAAPDPAAARTALLRVLRARANQAATAALAGIAVAAATEHSAPKNPAAAPPPPPTPPPPLGPPRHGDERELVVVRTYTLNQRIVRARLGSTEVRVRVADSRNLIAGMRMTCRFISADLWEIAQRLPRFRGKW